MRDLKENRKNFSISKQNKGPFCGQCNSFVPIRPEIPINATDPDQMLSQLAFNGLPGKGQRLCSVDGLGVGNDSCQKLQEFSPRTCGDCNFFHPDITTNGNEASMTASIIKREKPSGNIQYGKMGCYDDAYGILSNVMCTEPDKFQPKK